MDPQTVHPTEHPAEYLAVDELTFEVRRSPRRKTLGITLDRGGELIISAPPETAGTQLAEFVREKRFWLYTKMAEQETRNRTPDAKEFVTGEGFLYLGRSYRLLLVDAQATPLKLEAGRFRLLRPLAAEGREQFVRWYTEHARRWLQRRVKDWAARMGVEPKGVEVRDLGFRWGSCGRGGNLNFHWATILLPCSIVDYVIVHELTHLVEPNHTPAFWRRLGRALPEYEQRKTWLAEHGGRHVVL
ncbi:M48 family metallopeptidase [Thiocapsa bogorovii]|uniref:M48 family metallopeptidase n=1 Tax=Thiocapsa bogorovii TaxID=521689 RepID=UPI001E284F4C|nr:SprT family zinc-dependent metalloprotease [Thiocapsa bogorovii]UHD15733.1 M48 family metallopeptidase [Thiocapsa bogorovii]